MVDGGGLENRCARKGTGGSNPSPSAIICEKWAKTALNSCQPPIYTPKSETPQGEPRRWRFCDFRELAGKESGNFPQEHGYDARVARAKNRIPTQELTVSTNPQVQAYLQDLVDSGTFGNSEAEAAERLVASAIEQLIETGKLKRRERWQQPQ